MAARLAPYLSFRDNTREAMEFYQGIFGGELRMNTFGDFQAAHDPSENDKIMHSQLEAANGITFMAADTPNDMEHVPGRNIAMSLSGEDETELRGYFAKLAEGGTVEMPLTEATWGDTFGMLTDRFGIRWLVNVSHAQE